MPLGVPLIHHKNQNRHRRHHQTHPQTTLKRCHQHHKHFLHQRKAFSGQFGSIFRELIDTLSGKSEATKLFMYLLQKLGESFKINLFTFITFSLQSF